MQQLLEALRDYLAGRTDEVGTMLHAEVVQALKPTLSVLILSDNGLEVLDFPGELQRLEFMAAQLSHFDDYIFLDTFGGLSDYCTMDAEVATDKLADAWGIQTPSPR